MFERYTEKARRVIFFARYEAASFGSPYIETEHLLLGLLREHSAVMGRLLSPEAVASIRKQIEDNTTVREKAAASVDLPLSQQSKRVLSLGADEAQRLGHKHIAAAHLLAGVMREEKCFAAQILHERGVLLSAVREELGRETPEISAPSKITHVPQIFNLPVEMHAEVTRQAQARGLDMQVHLLSLVNKALYSPAIGAAAGATPDGLRETYNRLRERIEAQGLAWLDESQLYEEIARRKGMRP